jgi:Ala-tRNA(Pro) deacylase
MTAKLMKFLEENEVKYELIDHAPARTALETALVTHIDGKELAKTVIVRIDRTLAMVIAPATHYVDLQKLRAIIGAERVALADEGDFAEQFADCDPGVVPPFGNLCDMRVYAAQALLEDEQIVFSGGSLTQAVKVSLEDYLRIARPVVLDISRPKIHA